jgi:hypothetical protein
MVFVQIKGLVALKSTDKKGFTQIGVVLHSHSPSNIVVDGRGIDSSRMYNSPRIPWQPA